MTGKPGHVRVDHDRAVSLAVVLCQALTDGDAAISESGLRAAILRTSEMSRERPDDAGPYIFYCPFA
jgi:hypothetical protein